jgi:hypothetical protein
VFKYRQKILLLKILCRYKAVSLSVGTPGGSDIREHNFTVLKVINFLLYATQMAFSELHFKSEQGSCYSTTKILILTLLFHVNCCAS